PERRGNRRRGRRVGAHGLSGLAAGPGVAGPAAGGKRRAGRRRGRCMTQEWSERVWALFDRAAELPAGERAAFLDGACAGDAGLRAEVEILLAHDADLTGKGTDSDFLKSPLVRLPRDSATEVGPHRPPQALLPRVGHYRILRILGEGGMGTVYE